MTILYQFTNQWISKLPSKDQYVS